MDSRLGEWKVVMQPEPAAADWKRACTSCPRASPRITKSGLSLRLSLTRSKSEMLGPPGMDLVWRGFQPECLRLISLVSSMDTIFQEGFRTLARELSRVVFPEAVTPETTTNPLRSKRSHRYAAIAGSMVFALTSSGSVNGSARCFLMVKLLPWLVTSLPQVAASL